MRATAYKNGRLKLWSEKRGANPCHPGPPTGSRHEKGTVVVRYPEFALNYRFSVSPRARLQQEEADEVRI